MFIGVLARSCDRRFLPKTEGRVPRFHTFSISASSRLVKNSAACSLAASACIRSAARKAGTLAALVAAGERQALSSCDRHQVEIRLCAWSESPIDKPKRLGYRDTVNREDVSQAAAAMGRRSYRVRLRRFGIERLREIARTNGKK